MINEGQCLLCKIGWRSQILHRPRMKRMAPIIRRIPPVRAP